MARVIIEVITVPATKGMTDKVLGRKMTEAVKQRMLYRKKARSPGVLRSVQPHYISGKHPRYKIILTIMVFDAPE